MTSIQDILIAKAIEEGQRGDGSGTAAAIGSLAGAGLGLGTVRGGPVQRMAGILGAAAGAGTLGWGIQKLAGDGPETQAAELMAKLQVRGDELNTLDRMKLERLVADYYANLGNV